MKLTMGISIIMVVFSTNTFARCDVGSKTIFSCMTKKGKQIEVCDEGKTISYSFGKPQSNPDILVKVPRNKASTNQGVSSYSVDIPNGKTIYSVFYGWDRMTDEHAVDAGVSVENNGSVVATVKCSDKNIDQNMEDIDLKPSE